jgi:hypothetical protein
MMPGSEPVRVLPERTWTHRDLYARIRDAIYALPFYFRTETVISGMMATDIFTLNATLGATIEAQVVSTLNEMRPIWDIQDLIVVVPWALSNVISGSPKVFSPFVESARYAAEYRNYHWQQLRQTGSSADIVSPPGVSPYPNKTCLLPTSFRATIYGSSVRW